jgi:hypothetical protein
MRLARFEKLSREFGKFAIVARPVNMRENIVNNESTQPTLCFKL